MTSSPNSSATQLPQDDLAESRRFSLKLCGNFWTGSAPCKCKLNPAPPPGDPGILAIRTVAAKTGVANLTLQNLRDAIVGENECNVSSSTCHNAIKAMYNHGYTKLLDFLQDARYHDMCSMRLVERGYVVVRGALHFLDNVVRVGFHSVVRIR